MKKLELNNIKDTSNGTQLKKVNQPLSKGILRIFTITSSLSSFLGLLILFSIIVEWNTSTTFSYLPGFIVGVLLLLGGILMLLSLIIVQKGFKL